MTDTVKKLDSFTAAYIECALWSSTDGDDVPMDRNYSALDIAPEALDKMVADCERFQSENAELITDGSQAGHDFWLTRNGHGAGFWDGDWAEPAATKLTAAAHAFGSQDLYVGDDGRLYV